MQEFGKYIFIAGLLLALIGLVIWGLGDRFAWFGKLPGDIRVVRENFRFYMPITSMVLLSIVLSGLLWVLQRFFR